MDLLEGLGGLQAKVEKESGEERQGAFLNEANGGVLEKVLVAPVPLLVGKAWRRRYEAGRQYGLSFMQQRDQNYVDRAGDSTMSERSLPI